MSKSFKKVVLVTGGAGFIGSSFLRLFVINNPHWFFINLDALTYAGDLNKVESISNLENYLFVHGDICNRTLVEELFQLYHINYVINFAAESHVDNSILNSNLFINTNVVGTHTLIDVALKYWTLLDVIDSSRFIQVSTDEVYGSLQSNEPSSNESDLLRPNSPYSASKASAELICRSYFVTYNFPIIITRSSNNYGPFQNNEKLIPKIINHAMRNIEIPIYGNGNNIRDWIYVEDNCKAIMTVLLKGEIGDSYNIGGNTELSNNQIVEIILKELKKPLELKKYVKDRLGHDFRYSLNTRKTNDIGWNSTTSFINGIRITVEHYSNE